MIGGTENLLVDILNEQSHKNKVFLIIVNNEYNARMLKSISNRVEIILINRLPGDRKNIFNIFKLWWVLLKINPKIIHCHTLKLIDIIFPFKQKCLYTIHSMNISLKQLPQYKQLFSVSKAVKSDLKKRGNFESILVYNGINFSNFSKRTEYSFDNIFRIVQVARLSHEYKGQDVLINSIYILVNELNFKNIRVEMVGEGPSYDYLRDLIDERELQEYITLVGAKSHSWICKNLCHYHLLVQPSYFEAFGLTVIEGVAAGLPIVASNIDGPLEILNESPSALFFETKNSEDLAFKIKEMILDYKNSAKMDGKCNLAYNRLQNRFSVASTAENYVKHYVNLT